MTKFIIDKSSGSGTATIKVKPNSANDTSKVNYGVLKVYKKGDGQEKTLVGQVSLTQKAEVKPVTTYHLELWTSDGSKKLFEASKGNSRYDCYMGYLIGIPDLDTDTFILKSYALIKKGDTVTKNKVQINLYTNSTGINLSTTVNFPDISIDDGQLVIENKKHISRTARIIISQRIPDSSSNGLRIEMYVEISEIKITG